jgi:hypothetical protein
VTEARAAAFATWEALQQAIDRELAQHDRHPAWPSGNAWMLEKSRMDQRHLAAMRRYLDEHPQSPDRQDAMLGELRREVEVASPWSTHWVTDLAARVRESARRYLEAFPDSEAAREARLYGAVATLRGVIDPAEEFEWESEPPPRLHCDGARAELGELARAAETDRWAADAAGFAALCEKSRAKIDAYLALPEPADAERTPFRGLRGEVRIEKMRLDGLPAFDVVDLEGERWTPGSLPGRVMLIDFWAPT